MSDDHAPHGLSCYGSKLFDTPNIDRLANEGLRFTRAMGVNSLCSPARAALITGKHSCANGVTTNSQVFNNKQQTFPALLQAAGYQTALIGKWHLRSEPPGFDYYKIMRGHGSYFDCEFRESSKGWHREQGYLTNVITDNSIDWLKSRNRDQPFCMLVHHKAPHGPDIHEPQHAKLFEADTIPEPESIHDNWVSREPLRTGECGANKLINIHWTQDIYVKLKASAPKEKRARTSAVYQQMIKGYLRLVASLDENVGRLLDHIDESGLSENTIVIYTSDNGFFLGDHGLFNKMWMYEESLRIPLLVRYPGKIEAGSVNEELVSILDFAPTFLNLARVPIPTDLHGKSILPLFQGDRPQDWRTSVYYHFYGYGNPLEVPAHYGIRTKTHKLAHFPNHADGTYWELFDLNQDPEEYSNTYRDDRNKGLIEDLQEELKQHRKKLDLL
jgi:arylsulfatase A-like enzyme